ncbi:AzlC family ABC transporter permease [Maritalea myrionectae]|uniref:AzlC family ABC transporter permease n=1 Tax=Maritalea myrionectae TaxID=454601 RepID=UPI000410B7E3|nr:AzlC family ABC transporter permease [Maritalea myrionectae]
MSEISGEMPLRDSDYIAGIKHIAPLLVAMVPISLVFGGLAAQKGLSPLEVGLMSAVVFAGGSQFVAIDFWASPVPWAAIVLSALLVNVRHILMSASLGLKTRHMGWGKQMIAYMFLADEIWALSEHRGRKQHLSFAFYMGLVTPFYLNWVLMTAFGALLGKMFVDLDPAQYGLDFAFPAIFIGLIVGFWKGKSTAMVLAASGAAAIITKTYVDGAWYIAAGAVAGMLVGAFTADPEEFKGALDRG